MQKTADVAYELHSLIKERWSPRAFLDIPVETGKLCSLLEAARWAPSCFNDQPWLFFVGTKDQYPQAYDKLSALLMEGNSWANAAPVLMLSVARMNFALNNKPNRHAFHDVGLAVENLVLQAEHVGLAVHQMAGFDFNAAIESLGIPPGYEPVAMIAIGYPGTPDMLPGELRERELSPRERKPIGEMVFTEHWGQTYGYCFS